MKISCWMSMATIALSAQAAQALDVTNLDKVPHRVLFESAGVRQVVRIEAGDTAHIVGQPNGMLSLLTAEARKPSKGSVHADGILSGIIAAERTEDIPVDTDDVIAIWPDGHMGIQQHRLSGYRYR